MGKSPGREGRFGGLEENISTNKTNINKTPIEKDNLSDTFAGFFSVKINDLTSTLIIDDQAYNGGKKI